MERYFGRAWMPGVGERVEAPCGELCLWCKDPIKEGDSGQLGPVVAANGESFERPQHHECLLRHDVGSFGHQLGLCSCNGGPNLLDDPPRMTSHEAAIAARDLCWLLQAPLHKKTLGESATVDAIVGIGAGMVALPVNSAAAVYEVFQVMTKLRSLTHLDILVLRRLINTWKNLRGLRTPQPGSCEPSS